MALTLVNLIDTFDEWRIKTNDISSAVGDLATLGTTNKSSAVDAINEVLVTSNDALRNVVEDLTPQLGGDLDLFNSNITGTGNIIITGSYTGTLHSLVVGTTQSVNDNSTKVATTAYVTNEIGSGTVGGDLSGTIGNAQIVADSVGITELDVSDGTVGQVLSTNGAGTLSFVDVDLTVGGDLSGTISNAQIVQNKVGVNELNLSLGTAGQVITTDGAGNISFATPFTETTVSPTANQTLFPVTYTVGRLCVYINGVKMVDGQDYTATNGTEVTLASGVQTNDYVEFHTFL